MNRILDHLGRPVGTPAPALAPGHRRVSNSENQRMIKARFDAQFTTDDNRRHWQTADAMSVDAAANPMVRRTLRMRARLEFHNNSWFQGLAKTFSDYMVGRGPRLQMLTTKKKLNREIEKRFKDWAKEVRFGQKLRMFSLARLYNGEAFAILRTNPNLFNPVKLDLHEVEADQVTSPMFGLYPNQYADQFFDGVVLDPWGNPERYHILRQHPGAFGAFLMTGYEFDSWPARYVLHDFERTRPAQQRGIPEITPALEPFAQMRNYCADVMAAARTAAENAMVVQTDAPPMDDDEPLVSMDTVEIKRGMATILPQGWKIGQVKAEQPTTNYVMFLNAKLQEVSRCTCMPVMFVTLDATQANMASAYIITQPFAKRVQTERELNYEPICDRVFDEFLTEAIRIPGLLPGASDLADFPHAWQWPKIGNHADPAKVANGREKSLRNGITSIPQICAEDGDDWEEVQQSAAKSLGMSLIEYRAMLRQSIFATSGNPTPAALDPEPTPEPTESPDPNPPEDADDTD